MTEDISHLPVLKLERTETGFQWGSSIEGHDFFIGPEHETAQEADRWLELNGELELIPKPVSGLN